MMRLVMILVDVRIADAAGFSCYTGVGGLLEKYASDLIRYGYSSRNIQVVVMFRITDMDITKDE
jgi:hypothetical protein